MSHTHGGTDAPECTSCVGQRPQDQAAAFFMSRKGYAGVRPRDIEKLDGHDCWYYVYDLDDGTIELEVEWTRKGGWSTRVTTFISA